MYLSCYIAIQYVKLNSSWIYICLGGKVLATVHLDFCFLHYSFYVIEA
uniref:Uncharacterized protein n=1 Tax=Rhizophora mucronata TaxID=61149 RepID=A0A2P2PBW6_RHIMU